MGATFVEFNFKPVPAPVPLEPLPFVRISKGVIGDLPAIFEADAGILEGCRVHICIIDDDDSSYEGSAYVVYQRGRDLFEVEAYHCSCAGFEGEWEPMRVPRKYLQLKVRAHQQELDLRRARFPTLTGETLNDVDQHILRLLSYWESLPTNERPE
jgi:hypothetical protein